MDDTRQGRLDMLSKNYHLLIFKFLERIAFELTRGMLLLILGLQTKILSY